MLPLLGSEPTPNKTIKMKKPTNKAERDALIKELQAMTFNELPKRWDELGEVEGFYVDRDSDVIDVSCGDSHDFNRNLFPTSEQAEASIYLAMLMQLRDVYREGWLPDWTDARTKVCLLLECGDWNLYTNYDLSCPFSFQTKERAELFLENFGDYLEKVKPLFS